MGESERNCSDGSWVTITIVILVIMVLEGLIYYNGYNRDYDEKIGNPKNFEQNSLYLIETDYIENGDFILVLATPITFENNSMVRLKNEPNYYKEKKVKKTGPIKAGDVILSTEKAIMLFRNK